MSLCHITQLPGSFLSLCIVAGLLRPQLVEGLSSAAHSASCETVKLYRITQLPGSFLSLCIVAGLLRPQLVEGLSSAAHSASCETVKLYRITQLPGSFLSLCIVAGHLRPQLVEHRHPAQGGQELQRICHMPRILLIACTQRQVAESCTASVG